MPVFTWTATEGLRGDDGASVGEATLDPRAALDWIIAHKQAGALPPEDFHDPMRVSNEVRRRLRDLYAACFDTGKFVFISSPVILHSGRAQPRHRRRRPAAARASRNSRSFSTAKATPLTEAGVAVDADPGTLTAARPRRAGLTLNESRHALRRATAATQRLDASAVPYLLEEKHLLVKKKTGVIEYISNPGGLDNVGGVPLLKKWLLERRKLFEMRDQISLDIVPKGLLIMGISGCGKSLAVKAIAHVLQAARSIAST